MRELSARGDVMAGPQFRESLQRAVGGPPSPETVAVRDFLATAAAGAPVREVARSLQLSVGDAHRIVDRLVRRGQVREVRRVHLAGIKKPVCLYTAAADAQPAVPMFEALRFGIVSLD
jgi:hypothetical protein